MACQLGKVCPHAESGSDLHRIPLGLNSRAASNINSQGTNYETEKRHQTCIIKDLCEGESTRQSHGPMCLHDSCHYSWKAASQELLSNTKSQEKFGGHCLHDLKWWLQAADNWNSTVVEPVVIDCQISNDKSGSGWGSCTDHSRQEGSGLSGWRCSPSTIGS